MNPDVKILLFYWAKFKFRFTGHTDTTQKDILNLALLCLGLGGVKGTIFFTNLTSQVVELDFYYMIMKRILSRCLYFYHLGRQICKKKKIQNRPFDTS